MYTALPDADGRLHNSGHNKGECSTKTPSATKILLQIQDEIIHETKFMTINGTEEGREALKTDKLTVANCTKCTYLGAVITQDASIVSAVRAKCEAKRAHVVKFEAYVCN
jgi:hypothetical protein